MYRCSGIIAFAALSSFLLSGSTSPTACPSSGNIGPSGAQVAGALIGVGAVITVGTVVLVKVHNSHHTIRGCVTSGPDGIQVHNKADKKVYNVTGATADVKVGDVVKVHGNKEKHSKDSTGEEEFVVQKINRDYGPCEVASTTPPAAQVPVPAASTRTP